MRIYNRSSKLFVYTADDNKAQVADLSELDFDFEIVSKAPYKKDGKNHTQPTIAVASIYKLSKGTRDKLTAEAAGMEIQAGYDDDTTTIFSGVITNVFHRYNAPDWVTMVWASDGWAQYDQSFFNKSYTAGTSITDVIKDVAGSFAIPVVDRSEKTDELLTGTVFSGKTKDLMDRLARDYDLNWSIDSGAVTITDALNPPLVTRSQVAILSDDILNGPVIEETMEGQKKANKKVVRRARAIVLLNPGLFPGVPVQFKARSFERQFSDADKEKARDVDPDSYYICDEVTHRGSNWSPESSTELVTREEKTE